MRKRKETDKDSVTQLSIHDVTLSVWNYTVLTKSRHVPPMDATQKEGPPNVAREQEIG